MNRIFTFFILLLSFTATAQDFNTLNFKKPQYFKGYIQSNSPFTSLSQVNVLYYDSTNVIGNFTEYYGFKSIRGDFSTQSCIDTTGKSWFGSFGITDTTGVQVYLNQYDHTIRFETQDTVNQTWTAFYYDNGDILEGKVSSLSAGSIFSLTDETKAISFKRKDNNGNIIPDLFNTKELFISRDSGWISVVDFYNFPMDTNSLVRIPAVQILTYGACYDFQPGDIFQYHNYCVQWPSGSTPGTYIEREILTRQDYPAGDSVSYTALEKVMSLTFVPTPTPHLDTVFTQSQITLSYFNLSEPFFTQWPAETVYEYIGGLSAAFAYGFSPSAFCNGDYVLNYTVGNIIKPEVDSCYPVPFEPTPRSYEFAAGLGRTKLIDDQQSVFGVLCSNNLIWYKKNAVDCGNHVSLTGLNENNFQSQFTIGPNPAKEEIQIHTSQFTVANVTVFSADGKLQKQNSFSGNDFTIAVNDLDAGVYFLQIESAKKSFYKKIIITK